MRALYVLLLLWGVGSLVPSTCRAHALDPALLTLEETSAGQLRLSWSGNRAFLGNQPGIERGAIAGRPLRGLDSIEGQTILVRYRYHGQSAWKVRVLTVHDGAVELPDSDASTLEVLQRFIGIGLAHIATGPDHLLFVSCLLFLFHSFRALLQVITSFTIGHSITLALCTLGILRFPPGWVECCIALSLLFMARELVLPAERRGSIYKLPWLMTLIFGFIHGMGFAGALRELELPQGNFMACLLGFNLGVELGQVLFVAAACCALFALRRVLALASGAPNRGRAPLVWAQYAIGIVSAFWFWQRIHGALWS